MYCKSCNKNPAVAMKDGSHRNVRRPASDFRSRRKSD